MRNATVLQTLASARVVGGCGGRGCHPSLKHPPDFCLLQSLSSSLHEEGSGSLGSIPLVPSRLEFCISDKKGCHAVAPATPRPRFHFLQFLLPTVNCLLKILSGKWQKERIHTLRVARHSEYATRSREPRSVPPGTRPTPVPVSPRCGRSCP